jgi:hypothetical protein
MTWQELNDEIYELYEIGLALEAYDIFTYLVEFQVPGGGDYSNMPIDVESFEVDHEKEMIVLK